MLIAFSRKGIQGTTLVGPHGPGIKVAVWSNYEFCQLLTIQMLRKIESITIGECSLAADCKQAT